MYLGQVLIKNFRLFQSFELLLNKGLNVLVGENDSGKTSLIDAIRYTLGTNSSERQYIGEDDFFKDTTNLSIQLKFLDVDNYAYVFVEHLTQEEITEASGGKKTQSVLYLQLNAEKTGKEKRGYPLIRTELRSGKDGNGPQIESEIRDFLSTTYLKPLRDAEAELSSGRGSRLSQILNSSKELVEGRNVDKILSLIADTNSELVSKDTPIYNTAEKIKDKYLHELVFTEDKKILGAIINIAGVNRDQLAFLDPIQKRRYLRAIFEGLSLSLTKERKKHGLGYHNLLFMAAELLLLEEEAEEEFPLLLIEEPEAHLHPQLQMKLLQFVLSKVKTDENDKGIQCFITTHSPNISSKVNPADIIIMHRGGAFSLRPEETELDVSDYKFLRKFLDVTKANLFFARGVILVEGSSEAILIPTIAKLLEKPLEDYGVSIIQYHNSDSWRRFVKIFLRKSNIPLSWNPIKLVVTRDLDLWPNCAEFKSENRYGFKERKQGNERFWKEKVTNIEERKEALKEGFSRQNILIEISDEWTFEYCLALGLFEECYEAVGGLKDKISTITGSSEERATYIQSQVEQQKTDFAYKLGEILEKNYQNKPLELKGKLPFYIINAIERVTSAIDHVDSHKNEKNEAAAAT